MRPETALARSLTAPARKPWSNCTARPKPCVPRRHRSPSRASTEGLLLELRRRIIAPRTRRPDSWVDWGGGLGPHGDWPEQG
jgi:hypothetical protein